MIERLRRDPGLALVVLALALALALYAPTLARGIIDYDDPWLVRDNWLLQHVSWHSLHAIFFDTSTATRYGLGAEYLPVRDLSVMLDHAVWGHAYWGFHVTNVAIYLAAIAVWFAALQALGFSRLVAGLAVLVFAVHPSHAESVAWLSERKGLLAVAWVGVAVLGYARFRAGGSARQLVLAVVAAVAAVWSKAPAAFALAALVPLEWLVPAPRRSLRKSLAALAAIGVASAAAFVPVVLTASAMGVVGSNAPAPAGWLPLVAGVHGFYLELAAMVFPNAISYPIATDGPTAIELALGALGLVAIVAVAVVPRVRGRDVPPALRVAAVWWLLSWFPNSRIALPVVKVLVADRYFMFGSLAVALAVATGIAAIDRAQLRVALVGAIVVAAGARTLDAQGSWASKLALYQRAVASNPHDGAAWSFYAEELANEGRQDLADRAVAEGLSHSRDPHLVHREALFLIARGDRATGLLRLREAAEGKAPFAMSNLALMLSADGKHDEAIDWARRATEVSPMYPNGHRVLGKVLLAAHRPDEALAAWQRAYALEPGNLANRFNLALALLALHRAADARPHLEACLADPALGTKARELLAETPEN
ncbi:MAG: tetratricopeptide repeat protein [Acidobacteriota bacterium]